MGMEGCLPKPVNIVLTNVQSFDFSRYIDTSDTVFQLDFTLVECEHSDSKKPGQIMSDNSPLEFQ